MKPTSCKELKHVGGMDAADDVRVVEMKPTSCKELKHRYQSGDSIQQLRQGRNETYFL